MTLRTATFLLTAALLAATTTPAASEPTAPRALRPNPVTLAAQATTRALAGQWEGQLKFDTIDLDADEERIIVRFDADGTFVCDTHDLVALLPYGASAGDFTIFGESITLKGDSLHGESAVKLHFTLVTQERTGPVNPWLVLYDIPLGVRIALHRVGD